MKRKSEGRIKCVKPKEGGGGEKKRGQIKRDDVMFLTLPSACETFHIQSQKKKGKGNKNNKLQTQQLLMRLHRQCKAILYNNIIINFSSVLQFGALILPLLEAQCHAGPICFSSVLCLRLSIHSSTHSLRSCCRAAGSH